MLNINISRSFQLISPTKFRSEIKISLVYVIFVHSFKDCDCILRISNVIWQIASGEVFGPDQPICLKLLGSERSFQALEGMSFLSWLVESIYDLFAAGFVDITFSNFDDVEFSFDLQ